MTAIAQLGPNERVAFAECEAVIERGLQTFPDVGLALRRIRSEQLYRETDATFHDYCKRRWRFSDSRARQLIAAAKAWEEAEEQGAWLPVASERHMREYQRLKGDLRATNRVKQLLEPLAGDATGRAAARRGQDQALASERTWHGGAEHQDVWALTQYVHQLAEALQRIPLAEVVPKAGDDVEPGLETAGRRRAHHSAGRDGDRRPLPR